MPFPSLTDEIERLFDELVHQPWGGAARRLVPVEVREVADGWVIELPVEGMRATDLRVEVHGRQLTVTGHRRQEQGRRGPAFRTQTREEVSLRRTVALPAAANIDDIETRIEGSTLTIHVRKRSR